MQPLFFRAPGTPLELIELLARVVPELGTARTESLVRSGSVEVDGRVLREPGAGVAAGSPVRVISDADLERELRRRDPGTATSAAVWRVLTPEPAWVSGVFPSKGERPTIGFEGVATYGGAAELRVFAADSRSAELALRDVRGALAEASFALLGDRRHGGIAIRGGLRAHPDRESDRDPAAGGRWWPVEPLFPTGSGGVPPPLRVSSSTARVLAAGHPWILRDDDSGDASRFRPGALVELRPERGAPLGLARIEGGGRLMARVWARGVSRPSACASVEARVGRALERRARLTEAAEEPGCETDAYRLIHGEADGLPGLSVDRLGGVLRVLVSGAAATTIRDAVVDALCHSLASALGDSPPVLEVLQLRDRPAAELTCVRLVRGSLDAAPRVGGRLRVREEGLAFGVEPGLEAPLRPTPGFGLFLDQRENRRRLAAHVRAKVRRGQGGQRWLNLFAHTGAFSVALLAAGAEEVHSVDLSGAYLRWLDDNLAANPEIDASRHQSIRHDGRRHLERLADGVRFDGIVLDPPTAASAGRRFWSVGKDLQPLITLALGRLAAGGVLLVCRNDRRAKLDSLRSLVGAAAEDAGVALASVDLAPPGPDFPHLDGFPEGDSFSAVVATRSS